MKSKNETRLTLLGTATSSGVPIIGCDCPTCTSDDPRDTRFRTSAYIEASDGSKIVIDVGPDFRQQALRHEIAHIDGLLITHAHQDHIAGLDELRQVNFAMGRPIDLYANSQTMEEIKERFSYIFKLTQRGGGKPKLNLHEIKAGESFKIGENEILPLNIKHGKLDVLGYRMVNLAYVTDASAIPDHTLSLLQSPPLHSLVLNALRYRSHSTHFNIEEALAAIELIKPRQAYLIHFTHDILHARLEKELPPSVHPGYDGLILSIPGTV